MIEKKSINIIRIFFYNIFFFFFFSDPWRYIYNESISSEEKENVFLHSIFFLSVYFRMIFQHHRQQKYLLLPRTKKKWIIIPILRLQITMFQTLRIKMERWMKPKKYVQLDMYITMFICLFRLELKKVHRPVLVNK
jgi:hypothetical protein